MKEYNLFKHQRYPPWHRRANQVFFLIVLACLVLPILYATKKKPRPFVILIVYLLLFFIYISYWVWLRFFYQRQAEALARQNSARWPDAEHSLSPVPILPDTTSSEPFPTYSDLRRQWTQERMHNAIPLVVPATPPPNHANPNATPSADPLTLPPPMYVPLQDGSLPPLQPPAYHPS
ncbi:hypothetical protein BZG36_02536 [Bifiguratus adelaidae]|uniref:Uncharacterized protein n=1 Tax=Bifiguratus adelaidae TaxID=1938954 RepID=A0A261Y268_9FUNG|nr:hypothetical protein BZG36_02536 [Bifiguratus adelaidae]